MRTLAGYANVLSAKPGDTIEFKVSSMGDAERFSARLVRLITTEDHPSTAGLVERPVEAPFAKDYPARLQPIYTGSYGLVMDDAAFSELGDFTFQAWLWPTLLGSRVQTVAGTWDEEHRHGFAIQIDEADRLTFLIGDGNGAVSSANLVVPLRERRWSFVAVSYSAKQQTVVLHQSPARDIGDLDRPESRLFNISAGLGDLVQTSFLIAGHKASSRNGLLIAGGHYNGKVDSPKLHACALGVEEISSLRDGAEISRLAERAVADWDFSIDQGSDVIRDVSGRGLDGRLINMPTRAMKGHNWTGKVHDWRSAPKEYGAIHFHDDDLYDAGWSTDFTFTVPDELESGVYAARLDARNTSPAYVIFFVRPPRAQAMSKAAYLASTATYTAYANQRLIARDPLDEMSMGALPIFGEDDLFLDEHPEYGKSLYDLHTDGSGVCYSSRLRPVLNISPNAKYWSFGGDGYLTGWLDASGISADVITDEDLHNEGESILAPYQVVLTGCHPEYISEAMWDALKTHLARGGRLMYLGGNGFYWRTAFHPTLPGLIEVRRAEDGSRTWSAEPGEYFMSSTGEYGGLWRRQDRTPNQLLGVGFCAQGFQSGSYYQWSPGSNDPRADFISKGITRDGVFGDYGVAGNGAAGQELDRFDPELGSPRHALVIASSTNHTDYMVVAKEEFGAMHWMIGGSENKNVRSDIVFFETAGGGAMFSVGSISWCMSLPVNGYDNDVSRMTRNVLERFLDPAPFSLPNAP
ncbi:MAG: N,N-dimethylformamidase [Mesorhizobium sp.]|uniref:N,N-dimethylformamidase beta subunit family domain-containing protein n=1 Tax=Mesorhizobium sp. TaxID=1871066 RepID=UPI000FE60DDC|nr:N,N-dimethylformamidase beta subunit family domain-containing protein [Mesorhizobium sp.]RWE19695.1 MAG: N,N-dimethylformamidase [Mesorhizobium sp.]